MELCWCIGVSQVVAIILLSSNIFRSQNRVLRYDGLHQHTPRDPYVQHVESRELVGCAVQVGDAASCVCISRSSVAVPSSPEFLFLEKLESRVLSTLVCERFSRTVPVQNLSTSEELFLYLNAHTAHTRVSRFRP